MNKIEKAGLELIHGNFKNAVAVLTNKSLGSQLIQPARYRQGNFFFGVNGADKAFIWGGDTNSSLTAYQICPVVSSIINRMAQATINGQTWVMDSKGKESKLPQAIALRTLLANPNPFQTNKKFIAQNNVYKRIYGFCPVLKMIPVGFENDYTKWKLWNIPPWMLQIRDNTKLFWEEGATKFESIYLTYMGHATPLDPNSIFFIEENQISTGLFQMDSSTENVSMWLPDSKLMSVKENIINLTDSLNSRGALTRQRGPQWILSNDSSDTGDSGLFPIDPKYKEDLHADFRGYGIMAGQRKAIITDAKLKLQTVGFDVKQLQLLEGEIQDAKFIADALNYPPYLLGLVDAKFDNQQIAERNLYTNSIIPDSQSDAEQWGQLLGLAQYGLHLDHDYSRLPALQENIAEQGRGRQYMNGGILIEWLQDGITWNRWRELLGEDTVLGMDIYYSDMVKSGRILPGATAAAISASANNIALAAVATVNNNESETTGTGGNPKA